MDFLSHYLVHFKPFSHYLSTHDPFVQLVHTSSPPRSIEASCIFTCHVLVTIWAPWYHTYCVCEYFHLSSVRENVSSLIPYILFVWIGIRAQLQCKLYITTQKTFLKELHEKAQPYVHDETSYRNWHILWLPLCSNQNRKEPNEITKWNQN